MGTEQAEMVDKSKICFSHIYMIYKYCVVTINTCFVKECQHFHLNS